MMLNPFPKYELSPYLEWMVTKLCTKVLAPKYELPSQNYYYKIRNVHLSLSMEITSVKVTFHSQRSLEINLKKFLCDFV